MRLNFHQTYPFWQRISRNETNVLVNWWESSELEVRLLVPGQRVSKDGLTVCCTALNSVGPPERTL